jgi:hypothetical protein
MESWQFTVWTEGRFSWAGGLLIVFPALKEKCGPGWFGEAETKPKRV